MPHDLSAVHPELRRVAKMIPQMAYNRALVKLIRLGTRLQLRVKIPPGVRVERIRIPSHDPGHPICLRIYRPPASAAPAPILVWTHGGGFVIGNPVMNDAFLLEFVRELGIVIVSVDYRLAPEHPFPAALDDAYTALKWSQDHAGELGGDPGRIAVGGESAGGGLAATLAQLACDRGEVPLLFQLLIYPMLDDRSAVDPQFAGGEHIGWTQANNRFGWESYLRQAPGVQCALPYSVAARREDLSGLPPAWIGVGSLDLFCPEDTAYAQRLQVCGVACELVTVPGAFHGFDFPLPGLQIVRDFRSAQIAALRKHLGF
jgi:acetyl esterase/lipase